MLPPFLMFLARVGSCAFVFAALSAPALAQEPAPPDEPAPEEEAPPPTEAEPEPAPEEPKIPQPGRDFDTRGGPPPSAYPDDYGVAATKPAEPAPLRQNKVLALPPPTDTGFAFGSYGRIMAGSDLRGGTPAQIAVVAHAPRIVEPSYLETDLYYRFLTPRGTRMRTVTTLAFGDSLFHYTGQFEARPALRNVFLEATTSSDITLWVGSRMYRGDDLYLFDWWPLDEQNTLGGGASIRKGDVDVAVHAGVNRLLDPFQYQEEEVADPEFGSTTAVVLDRQRLVLSSAATYFLPTPDELDYKLKVYGELQSLPSGERLRADDTVEQLPKDWGVSLGVQLGGWGFGGAGSHANLFAKWSKGLTAFDELAPAEGLDDSYAAWPGASEIVLGAGGAYAGGWGNVTAAAYSRRFVDADDSMMDRDDGWEYAVDVRPQIKVPGDVDLLVGVDASYQVRFPRGLSPITLLAADPSVAQIAPMIVYAPMGTGAYARPQLRLVWRIARLNEAALDLYAEDDPRRDHSTVHFLGVQAEWWFNSSTR